MQEPDIAQVTDEIESLPEQGGTFFRRADQAANALVMLFSRRNDMGHGLVKPVIIELSGDAQRCA